MKNVFMSKNGVEVRIHPESHPHRMDLLEEAIAAIELPTDSTFFKQTVDLGHIIGVDHLVKTSGNSKIVMLRRGSRAGLTPMVINQGAAETSRVTVICCVATDPEEHAGRWVVVTLFEGEQGMPEPWDKKCDGNQELKAKCQKFWDEHALVPTPSEMQEIVEMLFDDLQKAHHQPGYNC